MSDPPAPTTCRRRTGRTPAGCACRATTARGTRSLLRRPLRAGDARLDPRAVSRARACPRACAYIDRARSALAERQRQTEELLHRGTAAFEDGQVVAARRLLTAAVEQGAPPEVALAYLGRLDRLEPASGVSEPAAEVLTKCLLHRPRRHARSARFVDSARRCRAALLAVTAAAWLAGAVLDFGSVASRRAAVAPTAAPEPVPVPNASDVAGPCPHAV